MTQEENKGTAPTEETKAPQQADAQPKQEESQEGAEGAKAEEGSQDDSEGKGGSDINKNIDYKKALEIEREKRKKAEDALAAKRFHSKKKKEDDYEEDEADEDNDDEDRPLTQKEFDRLMTEREQKLEKKYSMQRAEDFAKTLTGSEDELAFVMDIYQNRTFPAHLSVEEQITEAFVIANKDRLISERNEAVRALKNKSNVNRDGSGSYRDKTPRVNAPNMSDQDKQAYASAGFVFNGSTGKYEKKLPNGKTLVKDPKTKETQVI